MDATHPLALLSSHGDQRARQDGGCCSSVSPAATNKPQQPCWSAGLRPPGARAKASESRHCRTASSHERKRKRTSLRAPAWRRRVAQAARRARRAPCAERIGCSDAAVLPELNRALSRRDTQALCAVHRGTPCHARRAGAARFLCEFCHSSCELASSRRQMQLCPARVPWERLACVQHAYTHFAFSCDFS